MASCVRRIAKPSTAAWGNAAELTSRVKQLEGSFEHVLPGDCPYVVRLDGVSFKRYTATLQKPFDPHFTRALQLTTIDLMDRSAAVIGFCQSDEITLVGSPAVDGASKNLLYSGRTLKIASVLASLAAARFNHHMHAQRNTSISTADPAIFDARVFSVPDWQTAADVLCWRHRFDCRRNALHAIAQSHYDRRQLEGRPIREVIECLRRERGIDAYAIYPPANVYGTFVKRVPVTVEGRNPKTGEYCSAVRHRLECRSFDWHDEDSNAMVAFVSNPLFDERA